jgi:hypothetical protein
MQNWVPLTMILLAVAMAVGPIMMMRPSKSQQRLASLREKARKLGISVHPSPLASQLGATNLMRYTLPSELDAGEISLVRKSYEHDLHVEGFWELTPTASAKPDNFSATLAAIQPMDSIVAVGVNAQGSWIDWTEKTDLTLEQLKDNLSALALATG